MFGGFRDGMGAGGWVLMSLFWIALLAVVVWAVARLVPARGGVWHERHEHHERVDEPREPTAAAEDPLQILDRRLARGEIDPDTYEQVREKLSSRAAKLG